MKMMKIVTNKSNLSPSSKRTSSLLGKILKIKPVEIFKLNLEMPLPRISIESGKGLSSRFLEVFSPWMTR